LYIYSYIFFKEIQIDGAPGRGTCSTTGPPLYEVDEVHGAGSITTEDEYEVKVLLR
jgi:hypothetical protein